MRVPDSDQAGCAAVFGVPAALGSFILAAHLLVRPGASDEGNLVIPFLLVGAGGLGAAVGIGIGLLLMGYRFGPIQSQDAVDMLEVRQERGEPDSCGESGDESDKSRDCHEAECQDEASADKSRFANWRPAVKIIGFGMLVIVVVNSIAAHRYTAVAVTLIPMAVLIAQAVIWLRRRRSRQPIVARGKRRNRQSGR